MYSRRSFLAASALTIGAASAAPALAMPPGAKGALSKLLDGNARFVADKAHCPPLTARRLELAEGQSPFAIVVSCSDSRVPVETIFDQMPGAIFGVRVAGNFVDDNGLGSIEYAVAALKSSLILILGHSQCGAVKAAVEYVKDGKTQPGHIQNLVTTLAPAAKEAQSGGGDWLDRAIEQNVHDTASALRTRSTIVGDAVNAGTLAIAGAIYDLHTGKVNLVR